MIIDLVTLGTTPRAFDYALAPAEINLESEEVRIAGETFAKGTVTKHIAEIDIAGEITAPLEIECTRCLHPVAENLKIEFNAAYVEKENYTQAKEAELGAADLDVSVIEGNTIDLDELVREQILLNLPEKIFCREDCRGLCEKCGANRNLINCNCLDTEIDPRWAALKKLK